MKKVTLVILICFGCFVLSAQTHLKRSAGTSDYSVGLDVGLPTGIANLVYSLGLGLNGQMYKPLTDKFGLTGSVGYQILLGKKFSGSEFKVPTVGLIPLLVGGKYEFTPSLFGMGEIGVAIGVSNATGSNFMYSPSIGYNVSQNVDLSLKYKSIVGSGASVSQLALRVGYNF